MKECLENLVGLSQSNCECYEVDADLKNSNFGLFLDRLEGIDLELIKNAIGCGHTLTTKFEQIYSDAVNFFETDLQVAISENYRQRFTPYIGRIGERKYTAPISSSPLMGIKLDTKNIKGVSMIIDQVYLYFNAPGLITLQVYRNDELLDDEYIIDVVAGKTNYKLPTPLNLSISDNGVNNDYYFVYSPGALKPMDNKAKCGCAGIENVRRNFLTVTGVSGNDFNSLTVDSRNANGISLEAKITCSIDLMLCHLMDSDTYIRKTAMGIWYKMGQLTIEALFASREINFDTFSDREYLYTRKKKFESLYKNIILWLGENSNISESDCFICNPTSHSKIGKLLI